MAHGAGWYLPSGGELALLLTVNGGKDPKGIISVNRVKNGGESLAGSFWVSNEMGKKKALVINAISYMGIKAAYGNKVKSAFNCVVAIRAF